MGEKHVPVLEALDGGSSVRSDLKDPVRSRRRLRLQNRERHVVHRTPRSGLAVEAAAVCVAVQHKVCSMAIDDFSQP